MVSTRSEISNEKGEKNCLWPPRACWWSREAGGSGGAQASCWDPAGRAGGTLDLNALLWFDFPAQPRS